MAERLTGKRGDVSEEALVQISAFTHCKRMKVAPRVSRPFTGDGEPFLCSFINFSGGISGE